MPKFETEVEAEVYVDVDEFVSECSPREIRELVETLREDGHIGDLEVEGRGYDAYEFTESIRKLVKNYHNLTREETAIINTIAKRF